jgi:RHS repeat-associated protein
MFNTPNREYNEHTGQWMSPDPAGLAAVDMSNPQTWNMYAYVNNNPVSFADPTGLDCVYDNGNGTATTQTGDCDSSTDNGFYFNGTVDPSSISLDNNGNIWAQVDGSALMCSGDCPTDSVTVDGGLDPTPGTSISALPNYISYVDPLAGSIGPQDVFHCAAAGARQSSLASKARLQGDNRMSQAGQLMLDNTFSGLVDFYDIAKTATNAAPVYWSLFLNGGRLGLPGGGTISQGFLGTAQDAALKAAFANAGTVTAAQAARTVGNAKVAYDFLTFSYALFQCTF